MSTVGPDNAAAEREAKVEIVKKKLTAAAYGDGGINWKRLFEKYDKDHSGSIGLEEFVLALRGAKVTLQEASDDFIKEIFNEMDEDGGGAIGYDQEFVVWVGYDEEKAKEDQEKNEAMQKKSAATLRAQKAKAGVGILKESHIRKIKQKMKAKAYDQGGINLKRLYKFYDRNNDGTMNFHEFKTAVRRDAEIKVVDVNDEELKALFNKLDTDGGGEVSFEDEFLPWLMDGHEEKKKSAWTKVKIATMISKPKGNTHFHGLKQERLALEEKEMFETVRRKITASAYGSTGNKSVEHVFQRFDIDGSGTIDRDEFRQVIRLTSRCTSATLPDSKIDKLFNSIDTGGEGETDWGAFSKWLEPPSSKKCASRLGRDVSKMAEDKRKGTETMKQNQLSDSMARFRNRMVAASYHGCVISGGAGLDLRRLFRNVDRNNDGELCWTEFRMAVRKEGKITKNEISDFTLKQIFEEVDNGNKGFLSVDELIDFINPVVDEEAKKACPKHAVRSMRKTQGRHAKDSDPSKESKESPSGEEFGGSDSAPESPKENRTVDFDSRHGRPLVREYQAPFDNQIDQLMSLVRTQTEEVRRLRSEHSQQLTGLRTEYDALTSCLETAGVMTNRELKNEVKSLSKNDDESTLSLSPFGKYLASSPARSESALPFESADLHAAMRPLLNRTPGTNVHYKVKDRSMAMIKSVFEQKADPNTWNAPSTPLHGAQKSDDTALVRILLDNGALVNGLDSKGVSALHGAVYDGQTEVVRLLLHRRANPNILDRHDQSPMFFAPTPSVCEMLFKQQADTTLTNTNGQSAVHLAAIACLEDSLRWMTKRMPRLLIDMRDQPGFTAKDYAIRSNVCSDVIHSLHVWDPKLAEREEHEELVLEDDSSRRRRLFLMAQDQKAKTRETSAMAQASPVSNVLELSADDTVEKLGFQCSTATLQITMVNEGGWAEEQGMQVGDTLIMINEQDKSSVSSEDDLKTAMEKRPFSCKVERRS